VRAHARARVCFEGYKRAHWLFCMAYTEDCFWTCVLDSSVGIVFKILQIMSV